MTDQHASATLPSLRLCDLTLASPEENLAFDEALLDQVEATPEAGGILRFWEPDRPFVVVGYANQAATEVNLDYCRRHSIPVLRRCSGGGTVLQAPGCLDYSLILPFEYAAELAGIHTTNEFILQRNAVAISGAIGAPVQKEGDTDLAIDGIKFAGNAQRRKRRALIFHGCLLLNLDFDLLEQVLPMPSRQPAYRANRSHRDFLLNLKAAPAQVKSALISAWRATEPLRTIPHPETATLVHEKYRLESWNFKF
jgi:lipoate---protein ligase